MFVYETNVDFLKCLMRSHDIILEDLKILSSDSAVEKLLQCLDFINCQKTETDKRNVEFLGAVFFEVICLYKKD